MNVFYEVVRGSRLEKVINEQFTLITESLKSTFVSVFLLISRIEVRMDRPHA